VADDLELALPDGRRWHLGGEEETEEECEETTQQPATGYCRDTQDGTYGRRRDRRTMPEWIISVVSGGVPVTHR
jgi:hypothetical protein